MPATVLSPGDWKFKKIPFLSSRDSQCGRKDRHLNKHSLQALLLAIPAEVLYRKRHREGDFRVWPIDRSCQRREERAFWTENICKQHKECNRGAFRSLKVVGIQQRTGCQRAGWVTTSDAFIQVHVDHVPICFRSGHALLSFKPLLWPTPSKTRVMQTHTPIYSSGASEALQVFI